ncbi:MAG: hypothetical protein SNF68_01920 [Rikenellaceae bacterium]
MAISKAPQKRIVTSFHNLSVELQEMVKEKYPLGFTEAMMRIDKPNGDFFYAVSLSTDEVDYMVKIDVKIDDKSHEEDDKSYYDDDIKDGDEIGESPDGDDDDDL